MRIDGKAEGPRQSMSWLHTWSSLILGWLLYAIFVTGTLSFFQAEISVWMKPEFHQSIPPKSQQKQTEVALSYLQQHHSDAASWRIQLPNSRQNTTAITIREVGEDPNARRGGTRITLDSATGEVLEARETRGGGFLYRFHFELYGLDRIVGRWIVGLATMFMLVAIISGVITHKKIFKDFFTFRSGKGQRSWLDAHNASAILALPFHIMITFSGLLLLLFIFMPWGINQIYDNRQEFLQDQRNNLISNPETETTNKRTESRGKREKNAETVEQTTAPLTDLTPLLVYAQTAWGNNPIGSINITAPNTNQAKIELQALHVKSVAYRGIYPTLEFNGVTGAPITDSKTLNTPSIPAGIYNTVTVLHEARGLDLAFRWLLFFSGIIGSMMVATGLILWCVKRAPQQQKQNKKSFGYRLVEVMNIAAVIGLPIACAAYFYANRFIPVHLENRTVLEIRVFFIIWLLSFIHASLRQHKQTWLEQLMFASIAFALLPIVNFMTGGQALWTAIAHGQWVIATFDLAMWVFALLFIICFYKVKNHQGLKANKSKANPIQQEKQS